MSDPNDLAAFLAAAWQRLRRGAADARSPARYPTFATVSPDGLPESRTVALRRADSVAAVLEVHTDTESAKIASIDANPRAAFHVWDARANLQIRAQGRVEILTGSEVDEAWSKVPAASRVSYGTIPFPGQPIEHVYDYEKPPMRDRFAVLRCHLETLDLVELGERHRRAAYKRKDDWAGQWLAP